MNETNIITVTLYPSLDRTLVTHYLAIGYHNPTQETSRLDPAGKGISISRALQRLKAKTQAIVLLGNSATSLAYQALIQAEQFETIAVRTKGLTRSDTTILDTGNHTETKITEEGGEITWEDVEKVGDLIRKHAFPGDYVVFAGQLPPGAPEKTYAWLIEIAHELGAEAALVDVGKILKTSLEAGPDLVVLSQLDAETHFNYPVRVLEDIFSCGEKLQGEGAQEVFIEMRETNKAFLRSMEDQWLVDLGEIVDQGTKGGIWEAMLAGFLSGCVNQISIKTSLALGAAAASYTAAQIGYEFGSLQEIMKYAEEVSIASVDKILKEGGIHE